MALPDFLPSVGASFQCDRISGSNDKEARTYLCKQTLGNKETEEEWDSWQPEPTTFLVETKTQQQQNFSVF